VGITQTTIHNHQTERLCHFRADIDIANLTVCNGMIVTPSAETSEPCEACARATLAAVLAQEKNNADNQAAAAAEIVRANAQATLNSASSTQCAVLTQDAIHQIGGWMWLRPILNKLVEDVL
jgi:hypothetical protein